MHKKFSKGDISLLIIYFIQTKREKYYIRNCTINATVIILVLLRYTSIPIAKSIDNDSNFNNHGDGNSFIESKPPLHEPGEVIRDYVSSGIPVLSPDLLLFDYVIDEEISDANVFQSFATQEFTIGLY